MRLSFHKSTNPEIWTGRIDSETDPDQFRYHQVVKCVELKDLSMGDDVALLGFKSDEGVRRNGGRTGASEGPEYFRRRIGSLCWHGTSNGFLDVGDITPKGKALEEAQTELSSVIKLLLQHNKKPFVIGGGHETAFGHIKGIIDFLQEEDPGAKIGILNIDAHFDLRSYEKGAHSGSSFLQAHDYAKNQNMDLKYFVYGINPNNNTRHLFKKADELESMYCTNQEIFKHESDALQKLRYFIQNRTHIYLTVCLDVFHSAMAPGVSAPAWNGIRLSHAQKAFEFVKKSGLLISMDVCELNPRFDDHDKTTKVAGTLFSELLR